MPADPSSNDGSMCSVTGSSPPPINEPHGVLPGMTINENGHREIPLKIRNFAEANGYPVEEKNGQRKYGPPKDLKNFTPPSGTEVFIGKLPRDCYEDELVPIFSKIGKIYRFRAMLDFSGSLRGYAFCRYCTKEDANRAVAELNNHEIRRGRHIGLAISVDNCRLFAGGIPRTKNRDDVFEAFSSLTDGVVNVILYPSANDKTKNRGFAFIEYSDHQTCTEARRKLLPNKVVLWGAVIAVDWAEPEANPGEEVMSKVQILYVRNLMPTTTEKAIEDAFTAAVRGFDESPEVKPITRVKKIRDYAFVHFGTRQLTEIAKENMNGAILEGALLEVVFAKPQEKNFTRYIKDVVRMGSNALPTDGNVHQNIVTAAGHLMAANTMPSIAAAMHQSPLVTTPTLTAALAASQNNSLYAGFPFIDPNAGGPSENLFNARLANYRGRGSAGMRAAGFQQSVTNAVRRTRRKYSESLEEYCKSINYSSPIYEQTMSTTKDGAGRDIPLYVYKVTIPELVSRFGHFQPQQSLPDQESARESAAFFTMLRLGVVPESPVLSHAGPGYPQFIFPSMNQPSFVPFVVPDLSAFYAAQFQMPQLAGRPNETSS